MKETIVFATMVAILVPTYAVAQRGSVAAGIGRGIGSSGTVGRPSARPFNGSGRGVNGFRRNFGRGAFGGSGGFRNSEWNDFGWPYFDLDDYFNLPPDCEAGNQLQPNSIVVMPIEGVQPVDPPAQPEIHEYSWPSPGDLPVTTPNLEGRIAVAPPRPASDGPGPLFSIVSKDGTVFRARALWVQVSIVHFTTVDGGVGQLPLDGVDRESTHQANADRNLKLPLPGW